MAETILFDMAGQLLYNLGSAAVQEIGFLWGLGDELQKLKSSVSTIKAVLLDAEEKKAKNNEVIDWLGKLQDAFFDADDLLDDISTEALHRKLMTQKKKAKKLRVFFSRSNQLAFNLRISQQVKVIRKTLDAISEDRTKFHFTEQSVDVRVSSNSKLREESHSFIRPEEFIGREDDKNAIEKLLLDSGGEGDVSVIPIVGIGGLGKTALAQLVYNDGTVKKSFELRVWVCVSDNFDVRLISEKIIESITNKKFESLQMDRVQDHLRREIDGKKYLLVLDDVWNENRESWLKLRDLLIGGGRGSKILVTTRSGVVAAVMGTIPSYNLQGLPEEGAWSLFQKLAFKPGKEISPGLIATGKEIVNKCAGVPLAIRTLGSFLYYNDTEAEWLFIKNEKLSEMTQTENIEILPILKLSYDHLPSHLKHCFAYCSLFQKDQNIDKKTLIQLWIAQGFVKSIDQQNQGLEEVGNQYFKDLVRRSFLTDIKEDGLGNVISCKMHDLIHDLAQLIGGSEMSMATLNEKHVTESIRHFSFDSASAASWEFPGPLLNAKKLRTFIRPSVSQVSCRESILLPDTIIMRFKHLRVLDLHGLEIEDIPNSIGRLRKLRYLDLSENNFMTLPNSVTKLQNLQTLKLSYCYDLRELPQAIHRMLRLRHLELDGCTNLTHIPFGFGKLTSLKTLSQFVVAQEGFMSGAAARLNELNGLNNLQGELTITKLGYPNCSRVEASESMLKLKAYLQSLRLEWDKDVNGTEYDGQLLEDLQPNPNLKRLFIERYKGATFPRWMMTDTGSSLKRLMKLTLKNCVGFQYLPNLGQLPSLQFLKIESLSSLQYIDVCTSNEYQSSCSWERLEPIQGSLAYFPALIELKFYDLPNLKGWWKEVIEDKGVITSTWVRQHLVSPSTLFPLLSRVIIKDCPKLELLPAYSSVEQLELIRVSEKLLKHQLMMRASAITSAEFPAGLPFSKLKSLYILDIEDLVCLPELQNLGQLEHLEVNCCPNLLSASGEGMKSLTAVQFLHIHGCGLMSLFQGMQYLTALKNLVISNCKQLDLSMEDGGEQIQFRSLRSLVSVQIIEIPKLTSLPLWLQDVSSLQSLRIEKCYNLLDLPEWIAELKLLQRLYIYKCPKLKSLPEGISCLPAIKELKILMCPGVYKRCRNEKGADWHKIAHIQNVTVK